ncbi:MAG: hypothetical protein IE927_06565 [Rhodobacterales bacterium]|nr:hypothetical protein [Rhodobacterales bacterium]
MQMLRPAPINQPWCDALFSAKAVGKGGILRRSVRDVEREIGRDTLLREVRRRGFHLIECGDQFIILCNDGAIRLHC